MVVLTPVPTCRFSLPFSKYTLWNYLGDLRSTFPKNLNYSTCINKPLISDSTCNWLLAEPVLVNRSMVGTLIKVYFLVFHDHAQTERQLEVIASPI